MASDHRRKKPREVPRPTFLRQASRGCGGSASGAGGGNPYAAAIDRMRAASRR